MALLFELHHLRAKLFHLMAEFADHLEDEFAVGIVSLAVGHDRWMEGSAHHHLRVTRVGGDEARQDVGRDFALINGHRHTFGHILELAHIARPGVGKQQLLGGLVEAHGRNAVAFAHLKGKLTKEDVDVAAALAQRRHTDTDGRQTIVEVFAKAPFGNGTRHVDIGGSDDAHIGAFHLTGADGDVFARFEDTQQAHLRLERQFAHLVEEKRPAIGGGEVAFAAVDTTCESALDVAEEFGIDGTVGDGPAVEGQIFFALAAAGIVDDARDDFLTDTVFALNEHGEVYLGHFERNLHRTIERIAVAHDAISLLDGLKFFELHEKKRL